MPEDPKKIVVHINDCFANNNIEGFLDLCAGDMTWNVVGKPLLEGKAAIRAFMGAGEHMAAPVLACGHLIAEGEKVVSTGTMSMSRTDGTPYKGAFCDSYTFRDGLVTTLDTYIVDL